MTGHQGRSKSSLTGALHNDLFKFSAALIMDDICHQFNVLFAHN